LVSRKVGKEKGESWSVGK